MSKPQTSSLRLIKSGRTDLVTLRTLEDMSPPGARALHGELLVYRGGMCDGTEEVPMPPPSFRSDFYQLSLVRTGGLSGRLDQQDFQLRPGDLALIPPYHTKRLYEVAPHTEVTTLCFYADIFQHAGNRRPSDRIGMFATDATHRIRLDSEQMRTWDELVGRIQYRIDGMDTHTYGRELVISAFHELMLESGHLVQHCTDRPAAHSGRKEEIVQGFLDLARVHHAEQRHLAFYSDRLFVTSKHLSETVKEVIGRTARQVLDHFLLTEAKHLLTGTGLSISEVAFKLNFDEPSRFSKFFQRTSGSSPRSYRVAMA